MTYNNNEERKSVLCGFGSEQNTVNFMAYFGWRFERQENAQGQGINFIVEENPTAQPIKIGPLVQWLLLYNTRPCTRLDFSRDPGSPNYETFVGGEQEFNRLETERKRLLGTLKSNGVASNRKTGIITLLIGIPFLLLIPSVYAISNFTQIIDISFLTFFVFFLLGSLLPAFGIINIVRYSKAKKSTPGITDSLNKIEITKKNLLFGLSNPT